MEVAVLRCVDQWDESIPSKLITAQALLRPPPLVFGTLVHDHAQYRFRYDNISRSIGGMSVSEGVSNH